MIKAVQTLKESVPTCCHVTRCNRDGCSVRLDGVPPKRIIIDMDCTALQIPNDQKRCDYLFVGEWDNTTWVAPIEFKRGSVTSVSDAVKQLEGGVMKANALLPEGNQLKFVPILAHGKSIRKNDLKKLRSKKVKLRGLARQIVLVKCGDPLTKALDA